MIQTRLVRFSAVLILGVSFGLVTAQAQLPANFPTVTVLTNYAPAVASGYIFQGNNFAATNLGYYAMILTNDGTPIWYKELTNACYDFKVLPNGYLHYAQQIKALTYTGGGDVSHEILDESYNPVERIQAGNGYIAEAHDFQMLPNGHALLLGYYLSQVDMSRVVTNGNPAALVSGAIIQELDAQRNVLFQWRSWDHYPFTREWVNSTNAVISAFHVNCLFQDDDGHLVISTPDWVKKINRQTGEIMWHLGGTENQFTFVGVSPQQGTNAFRGHAINRLPNGHVLIYNNSAFAPGTTSTVHEYALDETNKIATHIWTYMPSPNVPGPFQGNAQRLSNGNNFIGWGGLPGVTPFACTEVADTNVVFQMKFNNPNVICYRAYRFPYPPESQANQASATEVASGNTYTFGDTGVSLQVLSGGGGYNRVSVSREPYAPVYPLFQGKAPRVLRVRVKLSEIGIDTMTVNLDFAATSLGFTNPTNLTVWYRTQSGQGLFLPQSTTYNPATSSLRINLTLSGQGGDLGEFVFCYPDLPDVAFPPLLAQVENYRGVQPYNVIAPKLAVSGLTDNVNQERPILLSWSPKGLAEYYEFQVATNQDFSGQVFQVPYQAEAFYVWNGAAPNTTYYYRVRTWNEAGASDWATGSFRTMASVLALTIPNGGEMWRSGLSYFIQWNANIAENVTLELYKGGVFVKTIASNAPSSGAYLWQVNPDLTPGSDYAIKIRSTTNSALADVSDAYFNINMPFINTQSLARLLDGRFSFAFTAPGATGATVQATIDFQGWQDVQSLPLTNGSAIFIDNTGTNVPRRFYRVKVP